MNKSGWKTTEFWVSLLTTVGAVGSGIVGFLPASTAAIVASVASAAYAISRGLAKKDVPK